MRLLFASENWSKGSISTKNCLKGLWLTIKLLDITSSSTFVNDFLPEQVKYLLKKGTNLIEFKFVPNWYFNGTTTCILLFFSIELTCGIRFIGFP